MQCLKLHQIRYFSSESTRRLLDVLGTMPAGAEQPHLGKWKMRKHYSLSTVYLQVLGSGAYGAPSSVYLYTNYNKYLFNCGESTQRLAQEHNLRLSKLDQVFITSKTWRNVGGLPGLSLTMQDHSTPNISIHGPDQLEDLFHAAMRQGTLKHMNVSVTKCRQGHGFEDDTMSVKYVVLDETKVNRSSEAQTKSCKIDQRFLEKTSLKDIKDNLRIDRDISEKIEVGRRCNGTKSAAEKDLIKISRTEKRNSYIAYICKIKQGKGALDLAKCVDLGVKPGPLTAQLNRGMDVFLPDGRKVLSKDVKTSDAFGSVFIVLEIPEISYLCESQFDAHFAKSSNPPENVPAVVVHLSPPHVLHAPEYISFMAKFGESTQHLVVNEMNSCLGSEAVHRTQHKLHILDPHVFPLLKDYSIPPLTDSLGSQENKELEDIRNKQSKMCNYEVKLNGASTLLKYHLRPPKRLDRSSELKLDIQEYMTEVTKERGFRNSFQTFLLQSEEIRNKYQNVNEYPRVLFLGTGSRIPSKGRNVSAIAVLISEEQSILLDCGEGTFCQLVRFFGPKNVNNFLRTLKAVYISHLHSDHHLGFIGLLQARRRAFEEDSSKDAAYPLYLLAPEQIMHWLPDYDRQFENILNDFIFVPNQSLIHDATSKSETLPAVLAQSGLSELKTCYVSHCPNAFGVALSLENDYKITYSGDTLPCNDLIQLGKNSDLLIHEATMEDDLYEEARTKMHSTMSQAAAAGRQMNAGFTILTHFSQRYARIPRLNPSLLQEYPNVGIAFDNMLVRVHDLPLLPHMYAPLQLMFSEQYAELERKAIHRNNQAKRNKKKFSCT